MDMKDERLHEELSAYLDGEAADPARVARRLQEDPDAARRYGELARLSARVKALPGPEVNPTFAARVMAHVRETSVARPVWPWAKTLTWATAAAAVVALIATGAVIGLRQPSSTRDALAMQVLDLMHQGNAAPIVQLLAENQGDTPDAPVDEFSEPVNGDDSLGVLASTHPSDEADEFAWGQRDLDGELASLSGAEVAAFESLLQEYTTGNRSI
jgi:negative regulator of sigma E activity